MGKPGAKKTDLITSLTPGDVHLLVPPTGTPVPTPLPVPSSIIKDNVAKKVKLTGQPGAVKGSVSKHTPPHIPIPPATFSKPPSNKGEIFTASSNVFYEGKAAAMLGDTAMMCCDPSDAPVGKVMGTAATVLIGGGGSGSDADRAAAAAAAMAAAQAAAAQSKLLLAAMTPTGHPVDVASGALIISGEDFTLASPLPLQFVRTYNSAASADAGPVGYGWTHNLEESIELIGRGHDDWAATDAAHTDAGNPSPTGRYLRYRDPNGITAFYKLPEPDEEVVDPVLHRAFGRDADSVWLRELSGKATRFTRVAAAGAPGGPVLRPVEARDRNGNRNTFRYDGGGRLVEAEDCYGRRLLIGYDARGQRVAELQFQTSIKAPPQRWCSYQYNSAGDLVEFVDRAGSTTKYAYADHLIVEDGNPDGYSFYFTYDALRRCNHTWGQDGYLTRRLDFDDRSRRTRVTNGEGETTIYDYTPQGRVSRTDQGGELTRETVLDTFGRPVANFRGAETVIGFTYGADGLTASVADGEQYETKVEHNAFGQVTKKTSPDGNVESFQYDARGNMITRGWEGGGLTHYAHDERGRVVSEQHPDGRVVRITYDAFGYVNSRSDGRRTVNFENDAFGNLLNVMRSWAPPITYEWNAQGYVTRVTEGGHVTARYEYNRSGDVTAMVDDTGVLHRFGGQTPGLLTEYSRHRVDDAIADRDDGASATALAALGTDASALYRLRFHLDSEGRRVLTTDHLGRTVRNMYDGAGRMIGEERPEGQAIEWEYGPSGELARARSIPGGTDTYNFDARLLPTKVEYADGSQDTFEYDEMGRLIAAANAWGELAFEYDQLGRQVVRQQGEFVLAADVDPADGAVTFSWPEGVAARYATGESGRTEELTFADRQFRLDRDAQGRLKTCRFPNGVSQSLEQDTFGRVTRIDVVASDPRRGIQNEELLRQSVTYDGGRPRVTAIDDSRWGLRQFRYDVRDRLVAVDRSDGASAPRKALSEPPQSSSSRSEFYRYDARDNLLACHRFAEATYGADQLLSAGDHEYGYDDRGRATFIRRPDDAVTRFAYNAKGQLTHADLPDGGSVDYQYDVLGRRVEKAFTGGARHGRKVRFFWDVNHPVKEEEWQGEELVADRFYLFTGLVPLARLDRTSDADDAGRAIYYHNDPSGRPRLCTDDTGEVVWQSMPDSYCHGGGEGTVPQNLRMPGQYFDEETGLYYNRHRYYDPHAARYLQPDPIVRLTDVNRYAYPTDPISTIDPHGMETMIIVAEPNDPVLTGGILKEGRDKGQYFEGSTKRLLAARENSTDANMFDSTEPDLDGVDHVILNAHGSPYTIDVFDPSTGRSWRMNGTQVGKYLKARGFEGTKVTVIACNAGAPGGKFAQDLANELGPGVEVKAPTEEISVSPDGTYRVHDGGRMKAFKAADGAPMTLPNVPPSSSDAPTRRIRRPAPGTAGGGDDEVTAVRPRPGGASGDDEVTGVRPRPDNTAGGGAVTAVERNPGPAIENDENDPPIGPPIGPRTKVGFAPAPPAPGDKDNDPPIEPPPPTKRSGT